MNTKYYHDLQAGSNLDASGLASLVISCNYPPSVSDVSVSMHAFRRVRKNEAMHVLVHDIVFYSHVLIK